MSHGEEEDDKGREESVVLPECDDQEEEGEQAEGGGYGDEARAVDLPGQRDPLDEGQVEGEVEHNEEVGRQADQRRMERYVASIAERGGQEGYEVGGVDCYSAGRQPEQRVQLDTHSLRATRLALLGTDNTLLRLRLIVVVVLVLKRKPSETTR